MSVVGEQALYDLVGELVTKLCFNNLDNLRNEKDAKVILNALS